MTDCRFCRGERPAADHKVADLGITGAYLHDDQFFPGWTVLVPVLSALFTPRKINYELLGNQTPHIHWHVVPRLVDDPAPLDAVWTVPHTPRRLDAAALAARLAALRARLGA